MKKSMLFILLLVILTVFGSGEEEKLLQADVSIKPIWLSKGQEGRVVIEFEIEEGVTINPQPSFIIEFNPIEEVIFPKNFFTASDIEIKTLEEEGKEFLDLKEEIEIPFSINLEAGPGKHIIEGKIQYFACSNDEEWCIKTSTKFKATFYVRRK
ncbi:MAG: hypothetical protein ACOC5F_04350 [Candidatus Aminicenantaceae bacterium]